MTTTTTTNTTTATAPSAVNSKMNKFILAQNLWRSGKSCLEKLKALLKVMDNTTSLLVRSSKRWSMAAAISVGIEHDDKDETVDDEESEKENDLNLIAEREEMNRNFDWGWYRLSEK